LKGLPRNLYQAHGSGLAYRGAFYAAAYGRAVRRARFAAVCFSRRISGRPESLPRTYDKLMFCLLELVTVR
jgi:hypothetical protein